MDGERPALMRDLEKMDVVRIDVAILEKAGVQIFQLHFPIITLLGRCSGLLRLFRRRGRLRRRAGSGSRKETADSQPNGQSMYPHSTYLLRKIFSHHIDSIPSKRRGYNPFVSPAARNFDSSFPIVSRRKPFLFWAMCGQNDAKKSRTLEFPNVRLLAYRFSRKCPRPARHERYTREI